MTIAILTIAVRMAAVLVADRFVRVKVGGRLLESKVGSKAQEVRLAADGGVEVRRVDAERQAVRSLSSGNLG